jgi:hypothetical protein
MKVLREIKIALVEDRNVLKWNIQVVKDGRMFGVIKPIITGIK